MKAAAVEQVDSGCLSDNTQNSGLFTPPRRCNAILAECAHAKQQRTVRTDPFADNQRQLGNLKCLLASRNTLSEKYDGNGFLFLLAYESKSGWRGVGLGVGVILMSQLYYG